MFWPKTNYCFDFKIIIVILKFYYLSFIFNKQKAITGSYLLLNRFNLT